ncbi:TPA: hypothetical protein ACH3X1_005149 [Trebouxia sp. C0004]
MLGLRAAAHIFKYGKSSPACQQLASSTGLPYLQMASQHTQGAKLRTPKGFNKLLAVNIGYGVDQHGQDATEAAVRAVQNAMGSTALPGVLSMVPGGHDKVKIKCKIGVPDSKTVDVEAVKKVGRFAFDCFLANISGLPTSVTAMTAFCRLSTMVM